MRLPGGLGKYLRSDHLSKSSLDNYCIFGATDVCGCMLCVGECMSTKLISARHYSLLKQREALCAVFGILIDQECLCNICLCVLKP